MIKNLFYSGQVMLVLFFRACQGFSVLCVGDGGVGRLCSPVTYLLLSTALMNK